MASSCTALNRSGVGRIHNRRQPSGQRTMGWRHLAGQTEGGLGQQKTARQQRQEEADRRLDLARQARRYCSKRAHSNEAGQDEGTEADNRPG